MVRHILMVVVVMKNILQSIHPSSISDPSAKVDEIS